MGKLIDTFFFKLILCLLPTTPEAVQLFPLLYTSRGEPIRYRLDAENSTGGQRIDAVHFLVPVAVPLRRSQLGKCTPPFGFPWRDHDWEQRGEDRLATCSGRTFLMTEGGDVSRLANRPPPSQNDFQNNNFWTLVPSAVMANPPYPLSLKAWQRTIRIFALKGFGRDFRKPGNWIGACLPKIGEIP